MSHRSTSAQPNAVPESGVVAQREARLAGHAPTVLLIEDDPAVLRIIAKLLRSHGYHVLTGQAGSESLRVVEQHAADIDVVIVDIVLPDMTGMQVAALITAKHPATPIIFATGVGNVGELKGIEEKRLLRKPFTESDLFGKIAAEMKGD